MNGNKSRHVQSLTPSANEGHRQTQFFIAEFGSPDAHGMGGQSAPCAVQYQLPLDIISVPSSQAGTLEKPVAVSFRGIR